MNKLLRNWGYLLVSNVFSTAISFFTFLLLAKKLTPDGYGAFNTLIAIVTLFVTFANNIIAGTVINREIVSQPKAGKSLVNKAILLRTVGFLVTSIALIVFNYIKGKSDGIILVALLMLLISDMAWELCEQIAFGYFITKISTVLNISLSVIWLVAVIAIPIGFASLTVFIVLYAAIKLTRSVCYWLIDKKKLLKSNVEKSNVSTRSLVTMSIPYFWMRIVGAFGEQIPILLLNGYSGAAQVAYYSVGAKFVMPITLMISTGVSALFPFLTKLYKENLELYKKRIVTGFVFVLIFGSTIAAFLTATSSYWLIWIMGADYVSSVEAFNYQVWFAVCIGFDLILSMIFSSSYRQKILAVITTIDIVIFLPSLFFAIPYGAKGLAIAKLVSALISVLYHVFVAIYVLKLKMGNLMFLLACCYFVILINISMFVSQVWLQLGLYSIVIAIYMIFRNSPLRSVIKIVKDKIKKKEK